MVEEVSTSRSDALDDTGYPDAVVDLLGVLAYGELQAFERLVSDAVLAPDLDSRAAIDGMAVGEFGHFILLRDRLTSLGVDPSYAMEPFTEALDAFHASTAPADWLEGLVKAYVGDGIGADFYREVAAYVDPRTRELVEHVCADLGHSSFVIETVRAAIEADPAVAGRLALWARRLVGEALAQAQRVAAEHEALVELLVEGGEGGASLAEIGRMLARITDNHAARMNALGLSP